MNTLILHRGSAPDPTDRSSPTPNRRLKISLSTHSSNPHQSSPENKPLTDHPSVHRPSRRAERGQANPHPRPLGAMAAPGSECGGSDGGYRDLRDVRVELDPGTARGGGGGGFAVCFWLYLSSSARPSSVILHQVGWILLSLHGVRGITWRWLLQELFYFPMATWREELRAAFVVCFLCRVFCILKITRLMLELGCPFCSAPRSKISVRNLYCTFAVLLCVRLLV